MTDMAPHHAGLSPEPAELSRQVRLCIEHARRAVVVSIDPERRARVSELAVTLLATVERDPFQTAADIAIWMADHLEWALADLDAWHGPLSSEEIGTRRTLVVELAKWLFPTFGRLPTYREEIARLRNWPRPFNGCGEM